ncbi:MAG: phenylalanine--tRNA ligase subunit alpha, partial [Pseudomonadota bacterium]
LMKTLGALDPDARKAAGAELNAAKTAVSDAVDARKALLANAALDAKLKAETLDLSLDPAPRPHGHIHPISRVIDEAVAIFADMGFTVAEGPQIEDDFHNFDALNIPPEHPARQEHDTFYLPPLDADSAPLVLRTHTSPVQIRAMTGSTPPIRIVAPGRTYRADSDATHAPNFHQIEGLYIDRDVNMAQLKGCLIRFCEVFFEVEDLPVRFRASYFPFTEPSAEMDIGCSRSGGTLTIGPGADWLEILGCGMVNPVVLKNCGLDPDEWRGFAFGMGIERIAMLKYGMPDLRPCFDSDTRWLRHYGFSPFAAASLADGFEG